MKDLKTALAEVSNRILAGIPNGQANNSFLGPSLYFSQEALKACQTDFLGERHIEMVYATLASWGMHRTGTGGALHIILKLVHEVFQQKNLLHLALAYQNSCGVIVPLPKIIDNVIIDIVGATKIP